MGKNFRTTLNEELKNPEFKAEYEALEPEYQLINAILNARKENNLTQKDLSEITGIAQGDISKIENGNGNPSIKTLKRLAQGMGKTLRIEFVDPDENNRKVV
jgi:transcriptional regulator with XRE-family HTH domain